MTELDLLQRFPAVRSRDPDEIGTWLEPTFAVCQFDMSRQEARFDGVINHRSSGSVGLTYARYGAAFSARLRQNDFFVYGIPISGAGLVKWNMETVPVSAAGGGIVGGPSSEAGFHYSNDFSHLVVTLSPTAIARKLSAIIGRPTAPPLELYGSPSAGPDRLASMRRLIFFFAEELDRVEGRLPPIALAEIEQAIIVSFLATQSHNYSHWLHGDSSTIAPWQVRRAAEYIEQNWNQPVTIETLSDIAQTSARSLFYLFKRTYGVSPMVFVRRIRLQRAREMLSNPSADTTVTAVGYSCGFSNLGNFARAYSDAFGELPSGTLRAHL